MSITDAEVLLNQETGLFVFLPVINYLYVYYSTQKVAYVLFAVASLLLASFIYNLATGNPDHIPKPVRFLFIISVLLWLGGLIFSMLELVTGVLDTNVFSVSLFFVSLLFLMLLATDALLDSVTDGYDTSL